MKRALIAAVWIGSLVVVWQLVRVEREPARPAASVATHTHAMATRLPGPLLGAPPRPAMPESTRGPEGNEQAFRDALATVERDIADGRWSAADRDRLNAALPRVTGEQAHQLLSVVFPKLNAGMVKSELAGAPI